MEMFPLKCVIPFPPNRLLQITQKGELAGQVKPLVEEAFGYLILKFNVTWTAPSKKFKTTDDVQIEGINLVSQGKADGVGCSLPLLNGLPENVTTTPSIYRSWCRIATSPIVESSIMTNGPELALKHLRTELLILAIVALFLMFYLGQMISNRTNILITTWLVYSSLVRQNILSMLRESPIWSYVVLILSTLLIQILFTSLLHTERNSIRSFLEINSLEDVQKFDLIPLILSISPCSKLAGESRKYILIRPTEHIYSGRDLSWCAGTGKCALLMGNSDFNLLMSFTCTLHPEIILRNPPYLSPILMTSLGGFFLNNNLPKNQRNRMINYVYRSFETGFDQKKNLLSKRFGMRVSEVITQMDTKDRCSSNLIQTKFSIPAQLSLQFYRNCFILYFSIIFCSFILLLISSLKLDGYLDLIHFQ